MSSQEVVDYVNKKIVNTPDDKLSSVCEELFEHCLAPDTMGDGTGCDNMTAVIVRFKPGFITVKNVITNGSTASSNGSQAAAGEVGNGSKEEKVEEEPAAKRQKLDCEGSEGSS